MKGKKVSQSQSKKGHLGWLIFLLVINLITVWHNADLYMAATSPSNQNPAGIGIALTMLGLIFYVDFPVAYISLFIILTFLFLKKPTDLATRIVSYLILLLSGGLAAYLYTWFS